MNVARPKMCTEYRQWPSAGSSLHAVMTGIYLALTDFASIDVSVVVVVFFPC